jgi:hypothetical protein
MHVFFVTMEKLLLLIGILSGDLLQQRMHIFNHRLFARLEGAVFFC